MANQYPGCPGGVLFSVSRGIPGYLSCETSHHCCPSWQTQRDNVHFGYMLVVSQNLKQALMIDDHCYSYYHLRDNWFRMVSSMVSYFTGVELPDPIIQSPIPSPQPSAESHRPAFATLWPCFVRWLPRGCWTRRLQRFFRSEFHGWVHRKSTGRSSGNHRV